MKKIIFLVAWITSGLISAGWWNAMAFYQWPNTMKDHTYAVATCREGLAMALLGGPISILGAGLVTGFGAFGWSLQCRPKSETLE